MDDFQELLEAMSGDAPETGPALGKVLSAAPLRVFCEGTTLEAEELLCNHALLGGAQSVCAVLAGTGAVGEAAGAASFNGTGTLEPTAPAWTVGDQLLLWPIEERQRYIIICKVVELEA